MAGREFMVWQDIANSQTNTIPVCVPEDLACCRVDLDNPPAVIEQHNTRGDLPESGTAFDRDKVKELELVDTGREGDNGNRAGDRCEVNDSERIDLEHVHYVRDEGRKCRDQEARELPAKHSRCGLVVLEDEREPGQD
jgi:hypothetical protein